jgi:GNAT superfamily N-acetyltransferase
LSRRPDPRLEQYDGLAGFDRGPRVTLTDFVVSSVHATLLGRLAVSLTYRGKGLGEYLLIDALKRSLEVSRVVGCAAVIVDAKDSSGVPFYERYGFKLLPDQNLRLFIAMKTIAKL